MERYALGIALALGIAVDVFFAVVNFYPVAPPRTVGREMYVVSDMSQAQANWFRAHILEEFNHEYNAQLALRIVATEALPQALADSANLAVIVPGTMRPEALHGAHLRELSPAKFAATIDAFDEANPLRQASFENGKLYFLPRMAVLDVAAYRPSKVRDAVLHWTELEPRIQAALRRVNGFGLPRGYELERTPAQWDAYDQFVIAYFWAHRSYGGTPAHARVAHRSDVGLPGDVFLLSLLYRAGARDENIEDNNNPYVLDAFEWEALYRREGLYADAMFSDAGMSAEQILEAFHRGNIFLAAVDQMEAFRLHGGGNRETPSEFTNPDDLSFYALPRGASLELNRERQPARTASAFSFREESFWASPRTTRDPELADRFLEFVWQKENHIRECEALGILPLRRDVVTERVAIFRLGWQQEIFEGTLQAWPHAEVVPPQLIASNRARRYMQHWRANVALLSAAQNANRENLRAALSSEPPAVTLPSAVETQYPERDDREYWRDPLRFDFSETAAPSEEATP